MPHANEFWLLSLGCKHVSLVLPVDLEGYLRTTSNLIMFSISSQDNYALLGERGRDFRVYFGRIHIRFTYIGIVERREGLPK
jgi:hypothetical protein